MLFGGPDSKSTVTMAETTTWQGRKTWHICQHATVQIRA